MEQKNLLTLTLSKEQSKEVQKYCKFNEIDVNQFLKDSFTKGFLIEKNGNVIP